MRERNIHRFFIVSVLLKGAHAIIEIVGGALLAVFSADALGRWLVKIDHGGWLQHHFPFSEQHFYAFYLLSHGIVKIVLVAGLLREKLWAYPASIAVFSLFIAYQLFRFTHTHDLVLIALSVLDLIVIALAVHEYRLLRDHRPTH